MAEQTKLPSVQSAPQLGSLTAEKRKKRYDELRKKIGRSKLEVKGNPNLHYFWAHRTDEAQVIEFETKGYHIVKEPDVADVLAGKKQPQIIANGLKVDGTYSVGDVILMACDLETYEFLMLDQDEQMDQYKRAAKDDFRFEAEKVGAPTFDVDKPRR